MMALRELDELTARSSDFFLRIGSSTPVISEITIDIVFASLGYKERLVAQLPHSVSATLCEHEWSNFVEAQQVLKEAGESVIKKGISALASDAAAGLVEMSADLRAKVRAG